VNRHHFAHLCSRTAVCLGLEPDAFDASAVAEVSGVDTQLTLNELTGGAYLMYDVGRPRPDLAGDVYRELLELNCLFVGSFDGVFMRDPINDGLLFSVRSPWHEGMAAEQFARWIRMMAEQVLEWRSTVLMGKTIDLPQSFAEAASPGLIAQRA
jgi:Tir chaperone protein (CesT) family